MKFKSLKQQIIVIFLSLVLIIQLVGLIPIQRSIDKNIRNLVVQELEVGEKVFLNLLESNNENIINGAKILAADYGFREAIASNDQETILSALNNFQSRIRADIAIFYGIEKGITTVSGDIVEQEALPVVQHLISNYSTSTQKIQFEILNDIPYQLVSVPIKAPITIGWMVIGFEIDDALAHKINKLSNLQVTFIQQANHNRWISNASTLGAEDQQALQSYFSQTSKGNALESEMDLRGELYETKLLRLNANIDNKLIAVLQRSITAETSQFQSMKYSLFMLIIVGLGVFSVAIIYVSNYIAAPIARLTESAKQLENGNYETEITSDREDEIGELSKSFNTMREAVATREDRVKRLAFWDDVTGLPNRVAFIQQLNTNIITQRNQNLPLSILVLNLNRFKEVNKILGRDLGDALLKEVANKIKAVVREDDYVAHLGADEYGALLPALSEAHAIIVADKLKTIFEVAFDVNNHKIDVSAGIGIAVFPQHGETDEALLHNAETALNVSKLRNVGVVVYEHQFDAGTQENLTMATDLKLAIQNHQLALYLQPKINIQTKQGYAAEALVRWIHPEKGFIFPDQFIPFAEQTGLIQGITLWMVEEACRVHVALKNDGIPLIIAVNISTRDLISADFPGKIEQIFKQHRVNYEAISLEITESSIMDDPVRAEATLQRLSQMGIKISIDDFGTGYSSLGYLKRLPVQELKIDKSFVMNMANNENDRVIVRSTIDLGHNLNLKVVAEGVENIEVWDLLAKMGCDYGQGYFMGKPMPKSEFKGWLSRWDNQAKGMLAEKTSKAKTVA
jgi:diguanylate cyclase